VVRKFKEQQHDPRNQSLDLHTPISLINAAEPVDHQAIQEFYQTFARFGLPGNCVQPTYGLAEHTVFVCSKGELVLTVNKLALEQGRVEVLQEESLHYTSHNSNSSSSASATAAVSTEEQDNAAAETVYSSGEVQRIVGCGYPGRVDGVIVKIVDPDDFTEKSFGEVGEVWVTSASKAKGYWNKVEQSLADFEARIVTTATADNNSNNDDVFLRTGDMGFLYKDELFICGRLKDLIIVGGSNHYPQDIERSVEHVLGDVLRAGCTAAFAMKATANNNNNSNQRKDSNNNNNSNRGTEDVIFIAEVKENIMKNNNKKEFEEIVQRCRACVSTDHGLSLKTVCLVRTKTIPKTTSGKIARAWCRRGLLQGTLSILYQSDEEIPPPAATVAGGGGGGDSNGKDGGTHQQKGYQKLEGQDTNSKSVPTTTSNNNNPQKVAATKNPSITSSTTSAAPIAPLQPMSQTELRNLPLKEIKQRVEQALILLASSGPTPLQGPLNPSYSLRALGLDSMTITQFHGYLRDQFYVQLPDEFLFSDMCTLTELAIAVQVGALTEEQQQRFNHIPSPNNTGNNNNNNNNPTNNRSVGATAVVGGGGAGGNSGQRRARREPLCPWFTCCY
jgi:acyl carrier protein